MKISNLERAAQIARDLPTLEAVRKELSGDTDVVIRHINTHTHIRSIEEEPAVRELIQKLDLEIINNEPK